MQNDKVYYRDKKRKLNYAKALFVILNIFWRKCVWHKDTVKGSQVFTYYLKINKGLFNNIVLCVILKNHWFKSLRVLQL